ncbi:MAG TPA: hypothetical protein VIT67_22995 [Povalibacter sp.]
MKPDINKSQVALAVATVLSAAVATMATASANGFGKPEGTYVTGDFHNHTTCSDGSISMQKLVKKATDKKDTPWGLDWFVQAGHGGSGNRNCTLAEDATLATPAYPLVYASDGTTVQGPTTTWQNTNPAVQPKGLVAGTAPSQNMWRWQSIQEYQYPLLEYLSSAKSTPLFIGTETVVPGHEHTSMSVIDGQMPKAINSQRLPKTPGYTALGNANALAQWEYCFDRNDTDTSRGNTTVGSVTGNNWDCSVNGSLNSADPSWNATAQKLMPASGAGSGERGHLKSVEAMKWLNQGHAETSYYVPAHLERAGPFNPNGNNGFNIEHLRNFNNAAPTVAFGMETQPGHGASDARGEYTVRRNNIGGVNTDSVGGTTYGGTGVYGAQIGGVWDALLGEGRNWWFFASSDWHNRGMFGPDDRRSTQDFYPGEYQRDFVMVRDKDNRKGKHKDMLTPQEIVDGLRSGNSFAASGQLVDRLSFVVCADTHLNNFLGDALLGAASLVAASNNTDVNVGNCATMGEKLVVRPGQGVVVAVVVRDPSGTNYSPYSFPNPSLAQVSITQPLNKPVLDHVDVVRGTVSGYKTPGTAEYSGQWPSDWITNPNLGNVPGGAKNTTAAVLRTFDNHSWKTFSGDRQFKLMTFRIPAVNASQYLRLRGSNLPASVPFETDGDGNPLADIWTNAAAVNPTVPGGADGIPAGTNLRIPCATVGTTDFDGCPAHLPTINGQKYAAYDVAAWSDLWFYSNPIFIEVKGSTLVAGVN